MARPRKNTKQATKWKVEVVTNPNFCGIDAGGVQFAHGKAEITDPWLAEWFGTHEGYKVTAIADETAEPEPETAEPETVEE